MCPLKLKGRSGWAFFRFRPGMTMTSSVTACKGIRLSLRCVVEMLCSGDPSLSDDPILCHGNKRL